MVMFLSSVKPVRFRQALAMPGLVVRESLRSFSANRNLESAATLAYYGFLSLMPLLLLAIFVLGLVLRSSEQVLQALGAALTDLFPSFNTDLLVELQGLAARKVWGVVGVVVLVWSMTPFAAAARSAVRRIFKADVRVHLVLAKLLDLAAILVLLLLFFGMVALKSLVPAGALPSIVAALVPFLLTFISLSFVYAVLAPVRLGPREWIAGALAATVLMSIIRPAFGLMLQYNPNFGYAFGSLKAIFLLIVWVYYTFAVLLFGAEVAANTRRREALVLRRYLGDGAKGRLASPALMDRFVRRLEAEEWLFREGETGREMFVILQGTLRLMRGETELKRLGAGAYFGEMSMLLDAPRTAGAQAVDPDTQVIAVSAANFDTLLRENPDLVRRMLREMAERVRTMNDRLAQRP